MRALLNIALCVAVLLGDFAWAQSSAPAASPSSASMVPSGRRIPKEAPRATMVVNGVRILNLNGRDYSLKPGCQILNEKNRIVLPQSLATNLRYDVRVKMDQEGGLHKVWMLTDEEKAEPAPILK